MPFPLPETVHPTEYICVSIVIPNEPTYRQVFIGHIHQLTRWFNHDKDTAHTAKQVGEEWMKAFLSMVIGDCDEMSCCPDENNIAYQTYRQMQANYQQALRMLDDGDTAASFGAPPTFDGDGSDNRRNALCRTINRLINSTFNDAAMNFGIANDVWNSINNGTITGNPLNGIVGGFIHGMLASHLQDLVDDCNAIREVACCFRSALEGQDTTIENLQSALGGCGFPFGTHQAEIAAMTNAIIQNNDNARAMIAAMTDDYDAATAGQATAQDCQCECCEDELTLIDFGETGCTIIPLGDCVYRIVQNEANRQFDEPEDYYHASIADSEGRCLIFHVVEGAPANSDDGNAGITDCCDVDHAAPGGFAEVAIKRVIWTHKAADRPAINSLYKIQLAETPECE